MVVVVWLLWLCGCVVVVADGQKFFFRFFFVSCDFKTFFIFVVVVVWLLWLCGCGCVVVVADGQKNFFLFFSFHVILRLFYFCGCGCVVVWLLWLCRFKRNFISIGVKAGVFHNFHREYMTKLPTAGPKGLPTDGVHLPPLNITY